MLYAMFYKSCCYQNQSISIRCERMWELFKNLQYHYLQRLVCILFLHLALSRCLTLCLLLSLFSSPFFNLFSTEHSDNNHLSTQYTPYSLRMISLLHCLLVCILNSMGPFVAPKKIYSQSKTEQLEINLKSTLYKWK